MAEALVFAFHDNALYTFRRTDRYSASVFGGPCRAKLTGVSFGAKPLHHIARLGAAHIPVLGDHHMFDLPLIYGMYYDGCQISYRIAYGHHVELLGILPKTSLEDWPYSHFPPLLPYVPLQLDGKPRRMTYNEFAARFPNMREKQNAEMIIAVPPPASVGLSLWGDGGDAEEVTIVFECDLKSGIVSASNVCS